MVKRKAESSLDKGPTVGVISLDLGSTNAAAEQGRSIWEIARLRRDFNHGSRLSRLPPVQLTWQTERVHNSIYSGYSSNWLDMRLGRLVAIVWYSRGLDQLVGSGPGINPDRVMLTREGYV